MPKFPDCQLTSQPRADARLMYGHSSLLLGESRPRLTRKALQLQFEMLFGTIQPSETTALLPMSFVAPTILIWQWIQFTAMDELSHSLNRNMGLR